MASTLFLFSLLTVITATTIPPLAPPPPPPSPPQDPIQEAHFNSIIDAIINAGDFRKWGNLLAGVDPSTIPFSATVFVPDDTAFLGPPPAATTAVLTFVDPLLFPYHVVPRRFVFSELLLFPAGARLPTLLAGKTVVVTNNSAGNFTVDGALVTRPDLYLNGAVAVHGVGAVLDYNLFGNDADRGSPPRVNNDTQNDDNSYDVDDGGDRVPTVVQFSGGQKSSSSWLWLCFLFFQLILGDVLVHVK